MWLKAISKSVNQKNGFQDIAFTSNYERTYGRTDGRTDGQGHSIISRISTGV